MDNTNLERISELHAHLADACDVLDRIDGTFNASFRLMLVELNKGAREVAQLAAHEAEKAAVHHEGAKSAKGK